MNMNMSSYCIC